MHGYSFFLSSWFISTSTLAQEEPLYIYTLRRGPLEGEVQATGNKEACLDNVYTVCRTHQHQQPYYPQF